MKARLTMVAALAAVIAVTGCSNKKLIKQQEQQIAALEDQLGTVENELAAERARTERLNAELEEALADMRQKEQVWMEQREGMTMVTLDGEVTFGSGSTRITPSGRDILDRVWGVVGNYGDRTVLIEGHTDNVPIAPQFRDNFRSNWELSSARAHSVRRYLMGKFNIDPTRIGAVGYGEHRPIASNDTPEGRSANRRVVITIAPAASRSSSGAASLP